MELGLTSLSDEAAESLSKHKGGDLFLYGLTSLSDAAAESLCELELGCLGLDHFGFITSAGSRLWPHVLDNIRAYYRK